MICCCRTVAGTGLFLVGSFIWGLRVCQVLATMHTLLNFLSSGPQHVPGLAATHICEVVRGSRPSVKEAESACAGANIGLSCCARSATE